MLAAYFSRDVYRHLYSLGDLDDFYWPHTRFYGARKNQSLETVFLIYSGEEPPVLLALLEPQEITTATAQQLLSFLPDRFYAHLSPGLEEIFRPSYLLDPHGAHYKMGLLDPDALDQVSLEKVQRLSIDDLEEIRQLYKESYPGNWFNPRMLETGQYFGIRESGQLCSIAGVHVYSETYQVASLGNITTHPDFRNQGYGTQVTAALCQSLLQSVKFIGLNVKKDNDPALCCYQKLGFSVTGRYGEFTLQKNL